MDHRTFMEIHGFVKKNESFQMRELNKKRFLCSLFFYICYICGLLDIYMAFYTFYVDLLIFF